MSPFGKARAMFAAALAAPLGGMGVPAKTNAAGCWQGHIMAHRSRRTVAQDKRAATKRRNVLRHRAACA